MEDDEYMPLPFDYESSAASTILTNNYECVTFVEAFGAIDAGRRFDAVTLDFEDGVMDCYEGEAIVASVLFELKAVE